jgi:hypothetical protein
LIIRHGAEAEDGWIRYVVLRELPDWPEYAAADSRTLPAL